LEGAPPLGSFVRAGGGPATATADAVYGVVAAISAEPLEPGRPVLARGEAAVSEEEVYRSSPQLARLLTSRFEMLLIGRQAREGFQAALPPVPPRIHTFVYGCTKEEIVGCTERLGFLPLLLDAGSLASAEVVAACLRTAAEVYPDRGQFLLRAGRALAGELSGDLPALNSILRRIIL